MRRLSRFVTSWFDCLARAPSHVQWPWELVKDVWFEAAAPSAFLYFLEMAWRKDPFVASSLELNSLIEYITVLQLRSICIWIFTLIWKEHPVVNWWIWSDIHYMETERRRNISRQRVPINTPLSWGAASDGRKISTPGYICSLRTVLSNSSTSKLAESERYGRACSVIFDFDSISCGHRTRSGLRWKV